MAWTYFTAPLAAGEELTALMWYELCEALAERLAVTGQTTQVDLTAAASIRDARVACRGVPISTSGGAAVLTPWTTILSNTQANWAENTTTTDALSVSSGNSFVTSTQWSAESLTESEWGTLATATGNGWNDRRYWNIIRATIQRLQIYRHALGSPYSTYRRAEVDPNVATWADLMADYFAATPTHPTLSFPFSFAVSQYSTLDDILNFEAGKTANSYTFPSAAALASAEAWLFVDSDSAYIIVDDTINVSLAGTTGSYSMSGEISAQKVTIGTGLDVRGSQTLGFEMGGYETPGPYQPAVANTLCERSTTVTANRLFIAPTWSKP